MRIVDAQIHVWHPNTPERPWPEGAKSIQGPQYTTEEALALMDREGVQRAILVPVSWTGFDNSYALEAARREPGRFAVMGRFNVEAPDAKAQLSRWRDQPGMLGIRIFIMGQPWESMLTDRNYDWFWAGMEELKLPLMSTIPDNIRGFDPILQKHPQLRLIIDHAGRHPFGPKDDAAWDDADDLYALSRYSNVSVKVSSLPSFSTEAFPFPKLQRHIRNIYDAFGAKRMLWGSDVTRLSSTYQENIQLFTKELEFLTDEDKEWIMGRAAEECCGWSV